LHYFFSILCVVFVDVIVSVKSAEYFSNRNFTHKTITITASDLDEDHIALFPGSLEKAITCISYCSLTYLCHFQLFSLEKELHRPKKWKLNFIVVASLILAYAIYNVMVFAAYLQFGGATKEDIMTNYPNDDPLVTAARILLFFTLLFSYPVLFHPTRAAINRLCNYCMELFQRRKGSTGVQESSVADETDMLLSSGNVPVYKWKIRRMASIESRLNAKPNFCVWICETWILFGATFLPAAVVPNVGYIWNFVGSIGGSLVLYIFPALFYIRLRYFSKVKAASEANTSLRAQYMQLSLWKDIVAFIILMTGIIVLVAGNYVAIKAIVSQSHTNIVSCYAFNCTFTNKSSHYY
jgi:amino acid permease